MKANNHVDLIAIIAESLTRYAHHDLIVITIIKRSMSRIIVLNVMLALADESRIGF